MENAGKEVWKVLPRDGGGFEDPQQMSLPPRHFENCLATYSEDGEVALDLSMTLWVGVRSTNQWFKKTKGH